MEKTFTVDWNDLNSIKTLRNTLNERTRLLNDLKPKFSQKEGKKGKQFEACFEIYNKNLESLFSGSSSESKKYYTYVHCNPMEPVSIKKDAKSAFAATLGVEFKPFYVGKGMGNRCEKLERNETYRKIVQVLNLKGLKPEIKIIANELEESKALELESKLIDIFGLQIYGGWLTNLDEGHDSSLRRQRYAKEFSVLNQKRFQLFSEN
jgi:hypothetical protein